MVYIISTSFLNGGVKKVARIQQKSCISGGDEEAPISEKRLGIKPTGGSDGWMAINGPHLNLVYAQVMFFAESRSFVSYYMYQFRRTFHIANIEQFQ